MDQLPLDGFIGARPPPKGRPRKWASEAERREAENEKRRKRRAHGRAPSQSPPPTPREEKLATIARELEPELNVRDADLVELAAHFPNVAEGFQYARDVLAGVVPACVEVRLACERHERDLIASEEDFAYRFDAHKAERALRAIQKFREVKGPRAGLRLRLGPWQRFIYASVFGWVEKETQLRRFHYVFIAVPRGNGKSTSVAPIALYMLALDGEGGAEVYAAAVTREQARIVFAMAQFMARGDREFRERYGVIVEKHQITQESTASTFSPLSRDADALDGKNVHLAILDELAKHKTREVHDVLVTGAGKRPQPLILGITTAASNQSGIGFEQWRYTQKILRRERSDERYFGIIYTIDEEDDWRDPAVWQKANPNWNVSVMPHAIAALAERAQNVPSQQNAFKQKHLNVWTNAAVLWLSANAWSACADPALREDDFKGEECVIGLDLAAKIDLAAKVRVFMRLVEGVEHYYVFARFYLPEATVAESANASYFGWAHDGWIKACAGETVDQALIEEELLADAEKFSVMDLAYDPWQALNLVSRLDKAGLPCIEYRPTLANFSLPMKELEALVREGRVHHDGNPVLAWNIACTEAYQNSNGDMRPAKDTTNPLQKIDGTVALLMALGRHMERVANNARPELFLIG